MRFLVLALLLTQVVACASRVAIHSEPTGAAVFVNGAYLGDTPTVYRDHAIAGTQHHIELRMDGYDTQQATLSRNDNINAGAAIGGFFFVVPFLWVMDYPSFRNYRLEPEGKPQ